MRPNFDSWPVATHQSARILRQIMTIANLYVGITYSVNRAKAPEATEA